MTKSGIGIPTNLEFRAYHNFSRGLDTLNLSQLQRFLARLCYWRDEYN